jgi:hypothetical protein
LRTALFEDAFPSEQSSGVLFPEGNFSKDNKKGTGSVLYFSNIYIPR